MVRQKFLKDDLNYLIFAEIYQRIESPRGNRKAFQILEAALKCLAKKGFEALTLEMVAREAGISRPMVNRYFKNLDELRELSIKYVRLLFQKMAVDAVAKETRHDKMLKQYVSACFQWLAVSKTHALVWFAFLHQCMRRPKDRALNTEAVRVGEERIQSLLMAGKAAGVFRHDDSERVAKQLQIVITGALLSVMSENYEDLKSLAALIESQCLALAGA